MKLLLKERPKIIVILSLKQLDTTGFCSNKNILESKKELPKQSFDKKSLSKKCLTKSDNQISYFERLFQNETGNNFKVKINILIC